MEHVVQETLNEIKNHKDFFEKARLINFLQKEKQIPLVQISRLTGIKSSYLCHILRLRKLPPLIIDGYYSKMISISHLFIISRLLNDEEMIELYEKVLNDALTVSQTEDLVREKIYGIKKDSNFLEKNIIDDFINKFDKSSLKVKIIQTRTRGKFIIQAKGAPSETSKLLTGIINSLKSLSE